MTLPFLRNGVCALEFCPTLCLTARLYYLPGRKKADLLSQDTGVNGKGEARRKTNKETTECSFH